jgi:hypothetical protein
MKIKITLVIMLLSILISHAQKTRYVSPSGNDSNIGTTESDSYKTINKALSDFSFSDSGTIYLLEGTYQEDVEINQKKNITIKPLNNANVVMNGTIKIEGLWQQHNGNIYRTEVSQDVWQLFINDEEKIMARWPNTTFDNDDIYYHTKWAHGNATLGTNGTMYDDSSEAFGGIENLGDISGSLVIANVGAFRTYVRNVTSNVYDGNKFDYNSVPSTEYKTKHHYYFLEGKLSFLDAQNEWFLDKEGDTSYVYAWSNDNGDDLNNAVIRGKNQTYAFDIINSENITIEGIKFYATTVHIQNGDYISIKDNVFSYPNCSRRMLGEISPPLVTSVDQNSSTGSLGNYGSSNCTFDGNVFEYTDGEGLILNGNEHTIKNNYFHHIDYSCGGTQAIGLTIYNKGEDMTFDNNVMHTLGASATLNLGERAKIRYNDISNTGMSQSDGSIVQITTLAVSGSETAYNWLHDSEKYGFRFDAPGSTPCTAGQFGLAHHNVIWNMGDATDNTGGIGMMVKGNNQEIYNNTVFNCLKTDILIMSESCTPPLTGETNPDSYTRNNVADFISNHRTNRVSSEEDIPGTLSNNVYGLQGDSDNQTEVLLTNIVTYDKTKVLENQVLYDFRPKASSTQLIDMGIVINETVYEEVVEGNITNGFEGTNPDIGAYEANETRWIPGINFTPTTYPWTWPSEDTVRPEPTIENSGFINKNTFEENQAIDFWSTTGAGISGQITNLDSYNGIGNSFTITGPNQNWDGIDSKTLQNKAVVLSDLNFEYSPDFTATEVNITVSFWIKVNENQDLNDRIKVVVKDLDNTGATNFVLNTQLNIGDSDDSNYLSSAIGWKKLSIAWNQSEYMATYKAHLELWLGNLQGEIFLDQFESSITDVNELSVPAHEYSSLKLYPQPVKNCQTLNIEYSDAIEEVVLFNMNGQKYNLGYNKNVVIPCEIAKGVYFLKITSVNGRTIIKQILIL